MREIWLDWLEPWVTYHTRTEEMIDAGERVVYISRDRGRREGMEAELEQQIAAVWTFREGRVARAEFYADREQGLRAAGVSE